MWPKIPVSYCEMDSKIFTTLNPQRWDGAKAISGNLRQRGENWSFHFPFLCLYICPLSVLCCVRGAGSPRQSNEGHVCSKQGHCYRGTACMANLVAYPVTPSTLPSKAALLHVHVWAIPKSSSGAGTLPGTPSTGGGSPGKAQALLALRNPHLPEPGEELEPQYPDHTRNAALCAARTARQERAAYHRVGRD